MTGLEIIIDSIIILFKSFIIGPKILVSPRALEMLGPGLDPDF
jgi:hypothetical protein